MSQKRKLEEFHDPDYPQCSDNKRKYTEDIKPADKIEKICTIIKREFENELISKEKEIMEIDNRLLQARILLHKVRYAVVADYYEKTTLPGNESTEIGVGLSNWYLSGKERRQKAIHPALKSLLGKKTVDYEEILKIRPIRQAAKTAKSSIKEKLMTKKEEKRLQREMNGQLNKDVQIEMTASPESVKIPRHVAPIRVDKPLPQLNSTRGRGHKQTKHLIVVGNTSKYIGDEKPSDQVTHKWLIYVQAKTDVPIEKLVNKVRFFLHPSYKPNDIVNVSSPPFQLSKRGWGEFPVRIQLFFHPEFQQKPVQLVHNLVLDKTLSGLQTMGAETLVEIWLTSNGLPSSCTDIKVNSTERNKCEYPPQANLAATPEPNRFEDNLLDFLNEIEKQNPAIYQEGDKIEPTITCSPISERSIIPPDKIILPQSTTNEIKIEAVAIEAKTSLNHKVQNLNNQLNSIVGTKQIAQNVSIPVEDVVKDSAIVTEQTTQKIAPSKVVVLSHQRINIGNNRPTLPISNPPKIFQKKIVKCIDKQGNVKFIPMLISANPTINGQKNIQQNGQVPKEQKNLIFTKLNGQPNSIYIKQPPVLKLIQPSLKSNQNVQKVNTITMVNNNNSKLHRTLNEKDSPKNAVKDNIAVSYKNVQLNNENTQQKPTNINQTELLSNATVVHPTINKNNTVPKNQVFMKDGKMFIIDPIQSKLKQQSKKQESLLKPQISLLKPIAKNDNLKNCIRNNSSQVFNHTALATDHDYTSLTACKSSTVSVTSSNTVFLNRTLSLLPQKISSVVTVNSPTNSPINVIVTQPKNPINFGSRLLGQSKTVLMQKPKRNYAQELEMKFLKIHFVNIRYATEYLLKQLPLINDSAKDPEYKISFPFVVSSESVFNSLLTPKQKSYEWLRAKYISKLIKNHDDIKHFDQWTTKEIILFARQHAYSPVITYSKDIFNNNAKLDNNETLKDLIKKEIKKEKLYHHTVTSAQDVYDWIFSMGKKLKNRLIDEEEIIDVESMNSEENADQQNKSCKISPVKNFSNKFWLPVENKLEQECSFVNEKCQEIGIRLQAEEIVPDVMHQSAQVVVAQCLRSFIEDLVRRSVSKSAEEGSKSFVVQPAIQLDDIKNAIINRPQFDFLTNKDLGIIKSKEEPEKDGTG